MSLSYLKPASSSGIKKKKFERKKYGDQHRDIYLEDGGRGIHYILYPGKLARLAEEGQWSQEKFDEMFTKFANVFFKQIGFKVAKRSYTPPGKQSTADARAATATIRKVIIIHSGCKLQIRHLHSVGELPAKPTGALISSKEYLNRKYCRIFGELNCPSCQENLKQGSRNICEECPQTGYSFSNIRDAEHFEQACTYLWKREAQDQGYTGLEGATCEFEEEDKINGRIHNTGTCSKCFYVRK